MAETTCSACAREVPPDAEFCPWCGARLREAATAPPPVAAGTALSYPQPRAGTSAATAVLLELMPLGAPIAALVLGGVLSLLSPIPGIEILADLTGLLFILALFSGIGWIAAGRAAVGCALMAARLLAMIVLLAIALGSLVSCWDDSDCSAEGVAVIVAVVLGFAAGAIIPIASAAILWTTLTRAERGS